MKLKAMFMLAVFTAASTIALSLDTLKVRSYRTINTCSHEKRFLIDAYLGEIYASDSLQSFDITIGYDTSLIRPTDGLTVGTLSSQMTFSDVSPFFNFRIPGEMRVGAFTIDRNVRGDQPFFAIAGEFEGSCTDSAWFDFPWEATFNGEFKRSIAVYWSDTVSAIATATSDTRFGTFVSGIPDTIPGRDSSRTVTLVRTLPSELQDSNTETTFTLDTNEYVFIDTVKVSRADSIIFNSNRTSATVFDRGQAQNDTMTVVLRSKSEEPLISVMATTQTRSQTECGCINPTGTDTVEITAINPNVSVSMDIHESTGINIRVYHSDIEIQFLHGQPYVIQLFTIHGEQLIDLTSTGETTWVATEQLPKGPYIMTVVSECCVVRRLLLK